jgi:hypothetical protein
VKKIKFEALGIETKLPFLTEYYDDGFVENIVDRVSLLAENKSVYIPKKRFELLYSSQGICFPLRSFGGFKTQVHIFYLNKFNDYNNLFLRAHEETHALHYIGMIKSLKKAISARYNKKISFIGLNYETIADIGGLYALAQNFGFVRPKLDPLLSFIKKRDKNRFQKAYYTLFSN